MPFCQHGPILQSSLLTAGTYRQLSSQPRFNASCPTPTSMTQTLAGQSTRESTAAIICYSQRRGAHHRSIGSSPTSLDASRTISSPVTADHGEVRSSERDAQHNRNEAATAGAAGSGSARPPRLPNLGDTIAALSERAEANIAPHKLESKPALKESILVDLRMALHTILSQPAPHQVAGRARDRSGAPGTDHGSPGPAPDAAAAPSPQPPTPVPDVEIFGAHATGLATPAHDVTVSVVVDDATLSRHGGVDGVRKLLTAAFARQGGTPPSSADVPSPTDEKPRYRTSDGRLMIAKPPPYVRLFDVRSWQRAMPSNQSLLLHHRPTNTSLALTINQSDPRRTPTSKLLGCYTQLHPSVVPLVLSVLEWAGARRLRFGGPALGTPSWTWLVVFFLQRAGLLPVVQRDDLLASYVAAVEASLLATADGSGGPALPSSPATASSGVAPSLDGVYMYKTAPADGGGGDAGFVVDAPWLRERHTSEAAASHIGPSRDSGIADFFNGPLPPEMAVPCPLVWVAPPGQPPSTGLLLASFFAFYRGVFNAVVDAREWSKSRVGGNAGMLAVSVRHGSLVVVPAQQHPRKPPASLVILDPVADTQVAPPSVAIRQADIVGYLGVKDLRGVLKELCRACDLLLLPKLDGTPVPYVPATTVTDTVQTPTSPAASSSPASSIAGNSTSVTDRQQLSKAGPQADRRDDDAVSLRPRPRARAAVATLFEKAAVDVTVDNGDRKQPSASHGASARANSHELEATETAVVHAHVPIMHYDGGGSSGNC